MAHGETHADAGTIERRVLELGEPTREEVEGVSTITTGRMLRTR